MKYFSTRKVFERLVHDLNVLEQNGIEVNGEIIKGSVVCICGDNSYSGRLPWKFLVQLFLQVL